MVGNPRRFKNGRGKKAKNYAQKFRLCSDSSRKIRSVSLRTNDAATARSRAKKFVEDKIKESLLKSDPEFRAQTVPIEDVLDEYLMYLSDDGNTDKHVNQVEFRVKLVIKKAGFNKYAQIDNASVKRAIRKLQSEGQFKTTNTADKYLSAFQSWTRWMEDNGRWNLDLLATSRKNRKIRGDTSNSRPRAILTQEEFEQLLRITKDLPSRRNLTGPQRYWLYLLASQTGLRAQELHSLSPSCFCLGSKNPFVEISNRISKRGKVTGRKDRILIKRDFAKMLNCWFKDLPTSQPLFIESSSWWYKAASMLRADLNAAGLPIVKTTQHGESKIDFHSFRGLMITSAMKTGQPIHIAMEVGRLSDHRLLKRYLKITDEELVQCVEAMPLPKL